MSGAGALGAAGFVLVGLGLIGCASAARDLPDLAGYRFERRLLITGVVVANVGLTLLVAFVYAATHGRPLLEFTP